MKDDIGFLYIRVAIICEWLYWNRFRPGAYNRSDTVEHFDLDKALTKILYTEEWT